MDGGVIVIGVEDGTLNILGIEDFRDYTAENLPHRLCGNCTNLSSEGLWVEAFETSDTGKIVWVLHVPKHQPRMPVYAHKTAWQRNGDNLVMMRPEKMRAILAEPLVRVEDWSRTVAPGATVKDLDPAAILMARANYKGKFPHLAEETDGWSDETFLSKAKICIDGKITRAAIILLGLPESTHYLDGAEAVITWILKDKDNIELDYAHFFPPFLLNVERAFEKIRNLKYRYIREKTLFPDELDMYDPFVIREALHNCVAHKDYAVGGKILLVEFPDRLIFVNDGSFIPGTVEAAIERDRPSSQSRNPFLANAMFQLNMIDTIGSGIKRMGRS
jgi:ATP-dependent DNA helicase RecG